MPSIVRITDLHRIDTKRVMAKGADIIMWLHETGGTHRPSRPQFPDRVDTVMNWIVDRRLGCGVRPTRFHPLPVGPFMARATTQGLACGFFLCHRAFGQSSFAEIDIKKIGRITAQFPVLCPVTVELNRLSVSDALNDRPTRIERVIGEFKSKH